MNMKLAIDVYYYGTGKAKTVGIIFDKWESVEPVQIITKLTDGVNEYESGKFYKRELPCIIELLKLINMKTIDMIIIDGYVYLDKLDSYGLGMHLYNVLEREYSIIGVAKTYFHNNIAEKLYRGNSKVPLYITSVGIEQKQASSFIGNMYGNYRIPKLLKILDRETKII